MRIMGESNGRDLEKCIEISVLISILFLRILKENTKMPSDVLERRKVEITNDKI